MKPKKPRAKPRPHKRPQRRLLNRKLAFLAAFKKTADLTAAAAAVSIDRSRHYAWLKEPNGKYAAAFAEAKIEADQSLHDSAVNRAMVGVYEPLVYQGNFTYPQEEYVFAPAIPAIEAVTALDWKDEGGPRAAVEAVAAVPEERRWRNVPGAPPLGIYRRSEMLHGLLLRAHIPAFRAQTVEVTGQDGGPVRISLAEVLRERKAKREQTKK